MNEQKQEQVSEMVERLTNEQVQPFLDDGCDRDGATPKVTAQATGLKYRTVLRCLEYTASRGTAFKALRTKGPGRVCWVYVSMKYAGAGSSPMPASGWVSP